MTLDQQFAQVRDALDPRTRPLWEGSDMPLAALSVIERHVQDMEKSLTAASEATR